MSFDPYKALYIHIPYCVQKCNYCDFWSRVVDKDSPEIQEYIEALQMQIRKASSENKLDSLDTIYIGGGTPSYIGTKHLSNLLYGLSTTISLSKINEFSMEANPESINESLVKDIFALGVDRLSLGVQSFNDDLLKMLGRAHFSKDAKKAIECVKSRFKNFSIDLMCGIPGQSTEVFKDSLNIAIELEIPHISIYPLSIEYNTVFYKWQAQGKIDDVDEDVQADHMELAADILEAAGYNHYEVASYAKPGFECKHNITYWSGKPYLGIGQSATTMTQNSERRMRVTDNNVEDDLNSKQMIAEDVMLSMRLKQGASAELIVAASNKLDGLLDVLSSLVDCDLLEIDNGAYYPTRKGWLCGNEIYSQIMQLGED